MGEMGGTNPNHSLAEISIRKLLVPRVLRISMNLKVLCLQVMEREEKETEEKKMKKMKKKKMSRSLKVHLFRRVLEKEEKMMKKMMKKMKKMSRSLKVHLFQPVMEKEEKMEKNNKITPTLSVARIQRQQV